MSTYDLYKNKRVTITLGQVNIDKMNKIANAQEYKHTSDLYREIIMSYINKYEANHGPILIEQTELNPDQTQ